MRIFYCACISASSVAHRYVFTGDPSKQDLRWIQKPIYSSIFTNNIWSYLLSSSVRCSFFLYHPEWRVLQPDLRWRCYFSFFVTCGSTGCTAMPPHLCRHAKFTPAGSSYSGKNTKKKRCLLWYERAIQVCDGSRYHAAENGAVYLLELKFGYSITFFALFSCSFSLLRHNSDPGSIACSLPPPPHTHGACLHIYREKASALSSVFELASNCDTMSTNTQSASSHWYSRPSHGSIVHSPSSRSRTFAAISCSP